jgi:Family of unknown function (DUF5367)
MVYQLVHHNPGEGQMKSLDVALLLVLGLIIWILGTVYYANRGRDVLETTSSRYWKEFILSPVISAVLCIAILRWRHIALANWTSAMLLLAIPGMAGEAVVLSNLSTFMPKLQAASGGRYAAFLFASYAFILGVAEAVTLGANLNANVAGFVARLLRFPRVEAGLWP